MTKRNLTRKTTPKIFDLARRAAVLFPTLGGNATMKQQITATILTAVLATTIARAQDGNQAMRRVVTGLDDKNHAVVLFDSAMPLKSIAPGIIATNFWITDSYPPALLKDDP
jgi:hypothetical protein